MAVKKRMAVTLPAGPSVSDNLARVKWAEDVGYDDCWWGDAGAPDALTTTATFAAITSRIRIGTAVTPVYSRTPAVFAASANTLGQLLPGRFVLGLGSSSPVMMENWHGQKFEKPLTRVKETAIMVRSMLAGEKSNFELETLSSKGYTQAPLKVPVPIYLAALRPKMIELATELGDGVIFNLWPTKALPKMMEHVKIAAGRASKDWQDIEIVHRNMVLVTEDKARARDLFRANFAPYYATAVYNNFLAWAGYEDAAAQIREGWASKDRAKTAAALSDDLVDEIAVIGSEQECRERLQWSAKGGICTHIISPLGGASPEEVQRTLDAFTPENFKLAG